jgi:hypothetical protein
MTSPKTMLSAAFAGTTAILLAVGTVLASQPGPDYLAVQSFSAAANNANSVRLSATTSGAIPRQADAFIASELIVGIAWADLGTGTAVVATIHPLLGRDSHQRPDAWHLHTVQLGGGATAPNDFCLVAVLSTPTAGIQISGSTIQVNLSAWQMPVSGGSLVSADDIDAAVGFTVHSGDAGCATGLGVRLSS